MTGNRPLRRARPTARERGPYGPEDTALLTEMERTLEKLLPWLEAEGVYLLNEYLEVYRRYEKGLREIPVWALVKLAELYHTSTDYLLGRTDNPSPPHA